jgi:hypothetical protein
MKYVQVKNVPPDVHEALRRRAGGEGMTMSEYVLALIRRDLQLPTQREWLSLLREDPPVDIGDPAEAVHEARAERELELDAVTRD